MTSLIEVAVNLCFLRMLFSVRRSTFDRQATDRFSSKVPAFTISFEALVLAISLDLEFYFLHLPK